MGWATRCDKKCPCKGKQVKASCKFAKPAVCEPACPTVQMASVPIIDAVVINNFNPDEACERYSYQIIVDEINQRTWFYDAFGVPTEIKAGGSAVKASKKIAETKQNKIAEYKPETVYEEGDIIIRKGELEVAVDGTTGAYNDAYWKKLSGEKTVAEEKLNNRPFIVVAVLPDNPKTDKMYILPNGDTFVFPSETLGWIQIGAKVEETEAPAEEVAPEVATAEPEAEEAVEEPKAGADMEDAPAESDNDWLEPKEYEE